MRTLAIVSSVLLAQGVAGFVAPVPASTRARGDVVMAERSRSLPYLQRPKLLDGTLAGDAGFDPLGLSELNTLGLDLYWFREAEIKHCRIAMLAVAGMIFVEAFGPVPGFGLPTIKSQVDAYWEVWNNKPALIGAGTVAIHVLEIISWYAVTQGRKTGIREPGEFFFDPLRLGKPDKIKKLQENELQNGRLAMIAAAGLILQGLSTHQGGLEAAFGN